MLCYYSRSGMGQEGETLVRVVSDLIDRRLRSDTLKLPAPSGAATRVIEILEDDDSSLRDVVEPARTEPMLALAILKRASAAEFGNPVDNLGAAVMRLGKIRLMRVVVEVAMGEVFVSKDRRLAADFEAIRAHSIAVAMLAADVAVEVGGDPETAYMAGLLHDVGKIVVANMLFGIEDSLDELPEDWSTRWLEVVGAAHRPIAIRIATDWRLPGAVAAAVDLDADYDIGEPHAANNIVRFANALAKKATATGDVDDEIEALVMVGKTLLGITDDTIDAMIADLGERVAAALH